MHIDLSRKFKCQANTVTLDDRNPHHAKRGGGITDDNFFAFASGDDQHRLGLLPVTAPGWSSWRSKTVFDTPGQFRGQWTPKEVDFEMT